MKFELFGRALYLHWFWRTRYWIGLRVFKFLVIPGFALDIGPLQLVWLKEERTYGDVQEF